MAAAAAVRAVAVAASGLILTAGLALVLWAVTPSSGADVGIALQSGVAAFAAANLMPVLIGGITLTLPPLLLTLAIAVLLAATARRGRFLPQGRYQEAVSILVTTATYGIVVAAIARGFRSAGRGARRLGVDGAGPGARGHHDGHAPAPGRPGTSGGFRRARLGQGRCARWRDRSRRLDRGWRDRPDRRAGHPFRVRRRGCRAGRAVMVGRSRIWRCWAWPMYPMR